MPLEFSAGAIIFRREKGKKLFLLLHYASGHWDFVKGHIEKGEKIEETIIREGEEETGIKDLKFIPGFKEKLEYFYKRDGETYHKDVIFLLAETKTEKVKVDSPEHQGYEWLEYDDAYERLTFKTAKEILEKAGLFLEKSKI